MEFKSGATEGKWVCTTPDEEDQTKVNEGNASKQKLRQALTDILLSENLVVLAGLGTSTYITNRDGHRVAPTMADLWAAAKQAAGEGFAEIKSKVNYLSPAAGRRHRTASVPVPDGREI
jgi:hypothetical protein